MYVRSVKEKELTFQVSGMLWQRSLVMRDLETQTLWSHLLGRGMRGELKGTQLELIPASMTTWTDWKTKHPKTSLLAMSRTAERYTAKAWEKPKKFVFGILLGVGQPAPSVSLARLQKDRVVSFKTGERTFVVTHANTGGDIQAFDAKVDGKALALSTSGNGRMRDAETGSEWNAATGEAVSGVMKGKRLTRIPGTISFGEAWQAFHPDEMRVE